MDSDEIEEEVDPTYYPDRLSWPTNTAVYIGLLTWMLDLAMMIVAITAWAGEKKPKKDETDPLKLAEITWTPLARKIQPAEIAIVRPHHSHLALVHFLTNRAGFHRADMEQCSFPEAARADRVSFWPVYYSQRKTS